MGSGRDPLPVFLLRTSGRVRWLLDGSEERPRPCSALFENFDTSRRWRNFFPGPLRPTDFWFAHLQRLSAACGMEISAVGASSGRVADRTAWLLPSRRPREGGWEPVEQVVCIAMLAFCHNDPTFMFAPLQRVLVPGEPANPASPAADQASRGWMSIRALSILVHGDEPEVGYLQRIGGDDPLGEPPHQPT